MNIPDPPKSGMPRPVMAYLKVLADAARMIQGVKGRNTSLTEYKGKGTAYHADRERSSVTPDCGGCVCIDTLEIVSAGTGYSVGENLGPIFGMSCHPNTQPFLIMVESVGGSGEVLSVVIIPGGGYSTPPTNPITFLGSIFGSGFTANCTFACTSGALPCPANLSVEFSGVIFDCGCVETGSGTSAIFTEGTFNGNPVALTNIVFDGPDKCGNSCNYHFNNPPGGGCPIGTLSTHYQFWHTNPVCSPDPPYVPPDPEEGDWDQCNIHFFLKDGVYRLLVTSRFLGFVGYPVFDGTTTNLALPIANTISCGIAHGGIATIT